MGKTNKKLNEDLLGDQVFIPTPPGQENMRIEVHDSEVITSGRDLEVMTRDPILRDLDVPNKKKGVLEPIDHERWLVVVETLMQRGIASVTKLSDVCGITYARADRFVREVRDRWANSLTMGQVNSRREQIYLEAERVKEECWRQYQLTDNETMRLAYLKMVIDCGKRQSGLIGAERINVNVESTAAAHKSAGEMEAEMINSLSISVDQFSAIGDMLSQQLTHHRKESEDG
jgi:hypothetical protein